MILPTSEYFFRGIFINICCIILCTLTIYAQSNEETKPEVVKKKKEKFPVYFSGIRVGAELTHLVANAFGSDRTGYEINGDIGISNRYFFSLDLGTEKYERSDINQDYLHISNGQYFRVGFDYNLLYRKTEDEALSFGLRYGSASFKHELNYMPVDSILGNLSGNIEENGLSGSWIEVVTAFKVRIIENLYLSPNFRIKFLVGNKGEEIVEIADMPGYGIAKSNTRVSLNYSILYRLPFRKK